MNEPLDEPFKVRDLGFMAYHDAWKLQLETHAAVVAREVPPTLLLVEHPPVITFGKKGGRQNLRESEEVLSAKGFELFDVERGGDVTYHGPGQLVGYPIFRVGRRVLRYLRTLEAAIVDSLTSLGIDSVGSPGYAGVWVGERKVVAIGVAVKHDVSFHGFAMNIHTDLGHFNTIVPCGLEGKGVTSLSELLGRRVEFDEVKPRLIEAMGRAFLKMAT